MCVFGRVVGVTAQLYGSLPQRMMLLSGMLAIFFSASSALISRYQFVPLVNQKIQSTPSALVSAFITKSKIFCSARCAAMPTCDMLSFSTLLTSCELYSLNQSQQLQYSFVNDSRWVSLNKTVVTDVIATVSDAYQSVEGARITSGQSELTTVYTSTDVSSAAACSAICETLADNCSTFSYNDQTSACFVPFINFYDDWTQLDFSQPGWTSYYKVETSKKKLLFKINNGIGVDLSGMFVTSGVATSTASRLQMAPNNTCGGCWLKSDVLEYWSSFNITKISIHFFLSGKDDGFVDLNAIDANISTFFTQSRLLSSSWNDLTTTTAGVTFGLGDGKVNRGRNFYAQQVKSCKDDQCWFAVNGVNSTCLDYSPIRTYPQLGYVSRATKDGCNHMLWADTLMVYGIL